MEKKGLSMPQRIALGLLAAVMFSGMYILSRYLSLKGGYWLWNSALRFMYVFILLSGFFFVRHGYAYVVECLRVFWRHKVFFMVTGSSLASGATALIYAVDQNPSWAVSATYMILVIMAPVVVRYIFGRVIPTTDALIAGAIFTGVLFVNVNRQTNGIALAAMTTVLLAALISVINNQLIAEALRGEKNRGIVPVLEESAQDPLVRLYMMTIGGVPAWIIWFMACTPPVAPTPQQWAIVLIVALITGIGGLTVFFHARHGVQSSQGVAIEATQSAIIVITFVVEVLFWGGAQPSIFQYIGMILVVGGIAAFGFRAYKDKGSESS